MPARSTYRILSLDGGGIRGLMSALWLQRLEAELPGPLYEHFDLVAGTSTGAILACAVSKGIPAERIVDLYVSRGKVVFPSTPSRLWSRATRLFSDGVSAPKYDGEGLERVLKDIFRTSVFGNLKIKPTLVTTYNTFRRTPVVFKNDRPEYHSLRVSDICKASASAPTYFPAHVIQVDGLEAPLIDGGVVANNPTACAIAEAFRVNKQAGDDGYDTSQFLVASFGTGETTRRITAEEAVEWGAAEWVLPLIDVLFDGSADSVDYIARQILPENNYFRFQTRLDKAYDDMDNADETNLRALQLIAAEYIDCDPGRQRFQALVERLKED